ncbi:flagellar basal body rod protein FlgB [Oribacterium sp. WCC10]|uniref:flagellar basal body rod protein FlgB n=1 Tax=Oribacterium sp. WCC10 TaxID=1855343 RepID=UPI0008EE27A5|nr:flagellar basal body rod protein FlgB [Oribacterium sp. WCC10]SFG23923.1 flagellar basal-body rod protein FlgB [Oribacterium sp. WCC10]
MLNLYGNGINLSERTLDYLWGRQNVTMNNIANVDTPGFKSQYVTFENALARNIRSAQIRNATGKNIERAIRSSFATLHTTTNESTRLDGNNVDMDQEQIELVKTTYEYQLMVQSINNDFSRLKESVGSF